MDDDKENNPGASDESTGDESSEEQSGGTSGNFSSSQYNPTSRGRPGQSSDDEDEASPDDDSEDSSADRESFGSSRLGGDSDETSEDEQQTEDTPKGSSDSDGTSTEADDVSAESEPETTVTSSDSDETDEEPASESKSDEPDTDESDLDQANQSPDVKEADPDRSKEDDPTSSLEEQPTVSSESQAPGGDEEEAGSGLYDELDQYRGFSVFEDLGPEAIEIVINNSEERTLGDGETIFEEGDDPNDNFFLILEGEIKIMKFMRTETTQVTILEKGDYLGEFGMFTGRDRMAGAEVRGSAKLLEIPKSALNQLRESDPDSLVQIYENMFQAMAKRFKALAEKAEKSQFWL